MPADPPPSLLITPDRRRQLTQLFTEARQLAAQPQPKRRRIHELLAQCVRADPGNILYLDELLANLKRSAERRGVIRLWATLRRWFQERHASAQPLEAGFAAAAKRLQDAPQLLWTQPNSPALYCRLAVAAGECEFNEVELRLLNEARRLAPDDPATLREVARALARQGRFEDAVGPWHAVAALVPGDPEALTAIDDLRPARSVEPHQPSTAPHAASSDAAAQLLASARSRQDQGLLAEAEQLYADAQAALGGDLALHTQRQQLCLAQSLERVSIAARRVEHDPHPRAQSLVKSLQQDHLRLQIELLALRAEQLPGDADVRRELGRCLKQAGNYSAAAAILEEALVLQPLHMQATIELGECRQHLRQFEQALACYLRAVEISETTSDEWVLLARYRAGTLAAAMGRKELAEQQFTAILRVNATYQDVAARLTSLRPIATGRESPPLGCRGS